MSLVDEILFFLSNNPGSYRRLRARMVNDLYFEDKLNQSIQKKKEMTARDNLVWATLSRLKKNGLVKNDNHFWQITAQGKKKLQPKKKDPSKIHAVYPPIIKSNRKVFIAFDIPEVDRKNRQWLRIELLNLNFKILQKSVWFGPAPLPKEFIDNLKFMRLIPHLKFFEVKETDIA